MSNVPGSNILNEAFCLIAKQEVLYSQFLGNTVNDIGTDAPSYAAPISMLGSFQAMSSEDYDTFGIDFQRVGIMFYTSNELFPVNRNVSNDTIEFLGNTYEVKSKSDWFGIDGWVGIAGVLQTNA